MLTGASVFLFFPRTVDHCFGFGLDPDSIRSVDPDSKSGSGFRRAKMTHKNRKKLRNSTFSSAKCSLLRAEGFSSSLDVLYDGLGTNKLKFLIQKYILKNFQL
jgi:hypothetical protein